MVVDDNELLRKSVVQYLTKRGCEVLDAPSGELAISIISTVCVDIVLTDLKMPKMDGIDLLRSIKSSWPHIIVILMTGYGTVESAVEAMRIGASNYITKPFSFRDLFEVINIELSSQELEHHKQKDFCSKHHGDSSNRPLVFASDKMVELFALTQKLGNNNSNVIIQGETGSGKELVARTIHSSGLRAEEVFLPLHCGSVPKSLLESQLFGHVKGAFTGAIKDSVGYFMAANQGTLFLDEITEISLDIQVLLLRAIQEKRITPVGGTKSSATDVRIIAATNRNLEKALSEGILREDLYYRLAVVRIEVPPLRERKEDIPVLAKHFACQLSHEYNVLTRDFSEGALKVLVEHNWPGNVRELQNAVERAFALGCGDIIQPEDFPKTIWNPQDGGDDTIDSNPLVKAEIDTIKQALKEANGNRTLAAKNLGISRRKLYRLLSRYEIS